MPTVTHADYAVRDLTAVTRPGGRFPLRLLSGRQAQDPERSAVSYAGALEPTMSGVV